MQVRAYKSGRLHTSLLRQGYKVLREENWDNGTWVIMKPRELSRPPKSALKHYQETGQLTNAALAWFLQVPR